MRRLCGEKTSEKSLAFEVGRHIHRIQSKCKIGSLCTRGLKRTSVFEFLNIVDLVTRFHISFPVPAKRPDDVLPVLEMVWINWAGPMSHLISDMGGEFEGELGEITEAHGIRQYLTASEAPWQNGHVERIWKAAARKTIKDAGARGFVEMRRLAAMVNRAKNARINSSGYSPAQRVIGQGYELPWSLLDEKQSGELASLELPDHSPEFGRRMSWL